MDGKIWPGFCCKGFDFVMDCAGYGICLNPDCPYGDIQAFQLENSVEFELDEEYVGWFE